MAASGDGSQRADESYPGIVARARAIICELSPDGTIVFVNPAVTAIAGYAQTELVGRNWWDVFRPGDLRARSELRHLQTHEVTNFELPITVKDGTTKTLSWTTARRCSQDGRLERIVGFATDVTESKAVQEKLRKNEALFRGVFEHAPIAIIVFDREGEVLQMNEAAQRLFGGRPGGMKGLRLLDASTLTDESKAALGRGETLRCEGLVDIGQIKTGKKTATTASRKLCLDYWFTPLILEEGGQPDYYLAQVQDITDRKRAEEERIALAREQAARAEAEAGRQAVNDILESIGDGFLASDAEGRCTYVNAAAERMLGVKREELIGKVGREVFPEAAGHDIERLAHRAVAEQRTFVTEFYNTRLNRLFEVRLFPAKDGGICSYFRDITESKRVEEERERLLAELEAMFTALPSGLVLHDRHGNVIRANSAVQRMLGYSLEDLGRPFPERVMPLRMETPDGRPISPEEGTLSRALRGETVLGFLFVSHPPGLGARWTSVSTAPIRRADGSIIGAASVLHDVTPLRELQEQRDDTLRAVSHDLRSPLTIIRGRAELIQRNPDRAEIVC